MRLISIGAGCAAARSLWRAAVTLMLVCITAASASALSLRLDTEMTQPVAADADFATRQLILFGASDVRRRMGLRRHEARSMQFENQILAGQINGNQKLIAHMKGLTRVQERTLAVLKTNLARQQAERGGAQAVPRDPVSLPPQVSQSQSASAVVSQPALTAPVESRVAGAVTEARSGISAESPLGNWLLGGAVGALFAAALGWLWLSAAARRKEADSFIMPAAVYTRAPSGESAQSDERTDASVLLSELWAVEKDAVDFSIKDTAGEVVTEPLGAADADAAVSATAGPQSVIDNVGNAQTGKVAQLEQTPTAPKRKSVDSRELTEVDTLIAFERFDEAKVLLDKMMAEDPQNPEYVLRHYHVRTQGGVETVTDDEAFLRAIMDGPMSDTLIRLRDIGRALMPGDSLFADDGQREEAVKVLNSEPEASGSRTIEDDYEDEDEEPEYSRTVISAPADPLTRAEPSIDGDAQHEEAAKAVNSTPETSTSGVVTEVDCDEEEDEFSRTAIFAPLDPLVSAEPSSDGDAQREATVTVLKSVPESPDPGGATEHDDEGVEHEHSRTVILAPADTLPAKSAAPDSAA